MRYKLKVAIRLRAPCCYVADRFPLVYEHVGVSMCRGHWILTDKKRATNLSITFKISHSEASVWLQNKDVDDVKEDVYVGESGLSESMRSVPGWIKHTRSLYPKFFVFHSKGKKLLGDSLVGILEISDQ